MAVISMVAAVQPATVVPHLALLLRVKQQQAPPGRPPQPAVLTAELSQIAALCITWPQPHGAERADCREASLLVKPSARSFKPSQGSDGNM